MWNVPNRFTFIDLFAGIGGFRIALEALGGECLGFSEIDESAISVYKKNFHEQESSPFSAMELGDIRHINQIPFYDRCKGIDLIVGGTPCQSWSMAGKKQGFKDDRGKLWNDAIRVIKVNKPKAFIFENVRGLIDPRHKESLEFILSAFRAMGYTVPTPQALNALDFGLPQNRERVFIVGFRKDIPFADSFEYPKPTKKKSSLGSVFGIRTTPPNHNGFPDHFIMSDTRAGDTTIHSWDLIKTSKREKKVCMVLLTNRRKKKYGKKDGNPLAVLDFEELIPSFKASILDKLTRKGILKINLAGGGFAYDFVNSKNSSGIDGVYRVYLKRSNHFSTLTATGTKDVVSSKDIKADSLEEYKEKFIKEIWEPKKFNPITSKEARYLQGFPGKFILHESETIARRHLGNTVPLPVIKHLTTQILKVIEK